MKETFLEFILHLRYWIILNKANVLISVKIRNNFNASVSEIANNKWQRAKVGVSIVSNDSRFLDSQLRKVVNFVETVGTVEIIESNIETF